jgi:hypothetical protein
MATYKTKTGLPDAIERREILAGNRKHVNLDELGEEYLRAGWLSDAIDFFERTGNREKLAAIKDRVIEQDVFLLLRLARGGCVSVSTDEWRRAAQAALAAGRDRSAALAFERAGDPEKAAEAKARAEALRAELPAPKRGRGGAELV